MKIKINNYYKNMKVLTAIIKYILMRIIFKNLAVKVIRK